MGRPGKSRPAAVRTAAQLVADVEHRIATGSLAPGHRLAPVRVTAEELGLAPNTVAAAYRMLGERGLVVAEGRRGTFVTARPAVATTAEEPVPADLIDLTAGNPDPSLLPRLADTLDGLPARTVLYGEPAVNEELARLFRADLAADGIDATHLAVVGGALDGIERVLAARVRPGDRVAVEDPGYASVTELVLAMGLRPVPLPMDPFGPRPEGLGAALTSGVAAVIVTPRAQNPTGAALDIDRSAELRAMLARWPEVLVIEDDHAAWVAGQPYRSVIDPDRQQWATVRSVAKSLGPDLRLAAVVGDALTIQRVAGRLLLGPGWVSHLLQQVVVTMLSAPDARALLARAADAYRQRRLVLVDALAEGGLTVGARSGLNVWIPVDDEARVVAGMQHRGYAVRAGARFRQASAPGIRVSTAMVGPEVLAGVAEALLEVLGSRPRSRSV